LDEKNQRDVELIAVAIDSRELLQRMADKIAADGLKPTFTFLSDPGHTVIDRYGLLNPNGMGWPHPTTYVLDKRGAVSWKFTEINYRIRPTNAMIMEALAKASGTKQ
jgi:peroxiredoxin